MKQAMSLAVTMLALGACKLDMNSNLLKRGGDRGATGASDGGGGEARIDATPQAPAAQSGLCHDESQRAVAEKTTLCTVIAIEPAAGIEKVGPRKPGWCSKVAQENLVDNSLENTRRWMEAMAEGSDWWEDTPEAATPLCLAPDDAMEMVPAATAAVRRAGDNLMLRVDLLYAQGQVLSGTSRTTEARALLEQAERELVEAGAAETTSPLTQRLADVRFEIGSARSMAGDHDGGIASYQQAIAIYRTLIGPDSVDEAVALHNIGEALRKANRPDEALASLREAARINEANGGEGRAIARLSGVALDQSGPVGTGSARPALVRMMVIPPQPPSMLREGLSLSPRVRFPPELPITPRVIDLANAIDAHQVIIVAGETGSGKTTQLPKICLAVGRGAHGYIGCTQPRRIAATSVAARVAQELDTVLGEVVGYKVRFNDRIKKTSYIKFMTDGILLAELQSDPLLQRYDTIIVDEAHERSLNIDFLLGYLKDLLPRRPDLRVIVSSATLATERFSEFFGGAPVIEVSGRTYPVDVLYRPPTEDEADLVETVANVVNEITELDPRNDVLVFLPGEREIREVMGELEQRALPHTVVLPLYAKLSTADQQRVFQTLPGRRVVLATNVAETSLTIPGIVYVVDGGDARINRYSVRTGVTQLLVEPISKASADQRKGRCGRTESGVCFRLYEEQDYESRPAYTDPEIKRVGLAGVILRMKTLRLGDVATYPFLDPPQKRSVDEGYRVLEELGAIDDEGRLTRLGEQLGRLPIDPRLGRMILGGRDEGALREVLVIAAVLGLQDPRDRPMAAQQRADEAHRKFRDEGSDFVGYLKMWEHWQQARARSSRRQLDKLCRDNFLSPKRMREWEDLHEQLVRVMRELDFKPNDRPASAEQLHRALLPGLLSKIGMWNPEARVYVGARQTRFRIHPSSALARKPPPWIMAAELVETSELFARAVAKIDPVWIEQAGGALCKRSHGDPHWEQKAGQVMAREQVTLYGLPIANRNAPYAAIDPAMCRELFIEHALVRQEYLTKAPFMAHNRALLDEVQRLHDKARRSDMLADEFAVARFFEARVPDGVFSGATFEAWRKTAEAKDRSLLELSMSDVLLEEAQELAPERYPDQLVVAGATLPLSYQFDPSADDDGVTVTVPLALLPQLDPAVMAWTIPGWHQAKLDALLDALPKAVRKTLAPLDELVRHLAGDLHPFEGPMLVALERAIHARTGQRIPRDAWNLGAVPAYLQSTFRVVDRNERVLAADRDLGELQRTLGQRARELWARAPRERHERSGLTAWDFDALPRSVEIELDGRRLLAYPALVETEAAVDLRLLESAEAAAAATRGGVRRLFLLQLRTTVAKLEAQLPGAIAQGPLATAGAAMSPRRQIVLRALDEAFGLTAPDGIPRSKATFEARLADGRGQVPSALVRLGQVAIALANVLGDVRAAARPLAGKAGLLRAAHEDIQSQLDHLVPPDLMLATPAARLDHIARYLRALLIRLQRLFNDPTKDQQKAAQVAPFWQRFQTERASLQARGRPPTELDELGWMIEELRVQTFAPELKTAVPVSVQRLHELWATLTR